MASYAINNNYKIKVLEISGRFTIENRDEFQAFIKENVDMSAPGTCIDATDLGYIDSSGIGELLRLKMSAAKTNHVIYVFGLSDAILKMFKMSQLNHVFVIMTKEEFESQFKA
ncbi:MAG TPA: STAS domain-containing protein [Leptospiraceae bacterium]|nr:STAS domain-containing protein [Leptospiraceae bacterium]HMX58198.1 STAS domain-containing protein [Leptospiraceae bacterium]HMY45477.1 STAS domain-containing protein [Leptospiraceae bacterium]HMZ35398.1 STAS domain-containing protein [Leptospiraceae bacterium]HNE24055.1 STAS domain-containing protein [Leptospiraceae bacterium]